MLVRRVLCLAGGTHAVSLDRLGKNDRGLPGVFNRCRIGRKDLVWVMTATVQAPDVFVGHGRNHFLQLRVFAEEVFARVGTTLGLEVLVLTVDAFFHALTQQAFAVHG